MAECLIPRPSPQALFDRNLNSFSANVLGGSPVIPESNEWYVVALNYARDEEFYAISEQQWKERDPRYACCDNLIAMAAADGIYPYAAGYSSGYAILTGTGGSSLPTSLEIIANSKNYRTVGVIPKTFPASGTLTVRITSLTAGADGNVINSTTAGTLATGVTGINSDVIICGGQFCGGRDAETCEAFRTRYIGRKQYQPRSNQAWAISKLLEWPCVTRVIPRGCNCCACDNGCGGDCECEKCGRTLDFYVMADGSFDCGIMPANSLQEIQEWFFGERQGFGEGQVEIGVCGSIIQPVGFLVDLYIDVAACLTPTQVTAVRAQIADLFLTISPSCDVPAKQVDLIVAGIAGANLNIHSRYQMVTPDRTNAIINACGDIIPTCDRVPCLRNIIFTGPSPSASGVCQ